MFTSHEGKTYDRRCEQYRIYQAGVAAYLSVGTYLDGRGEFGVAAVNGVNDFVGEEIGRAQAKKETANRLLENFTREMKALGFKKEEILKLLEDFENE